MRDFASIWGIEISGSGVNPGSIGDDSATRKGGEGPDHAIGTDVGIAADEGEGLDDGVGADVDVCFDVGVVAADDGDAVFAEFAPEAVLHDGVGVGELLTGVGGGDVFGGDGLDGDDFPAFRRIE